MKQTRESDSKTPGECVTRGGFANHDSQAIAPAQRDDKDRKSKGCEDIPR